MWLVMLCGPLRAQVDSVGPYVKDFPDHFFAGVVLQKRNLSFDVISLRNKDAKITFKPNNRYSLGASLNIFEIGVEVSYSVPLDTRSEARYGTSTVSDLQVNAINKTWMLDAFHQKYSGFYFSSPNVKIPDNQPYPHRDDLYTRNMGVSFSYIFNGNKFSMRSAYTFTERQVRSQGSFLFSYILSSFNLHADSSLVSQDKWKSFGSGSASRELRFTSLGIGPGYSYNFVYKSFFVNLTLSVGPAHYWIQYNEEGGPVHYDIRISTFSAARVGVGFNGDRFFGGVGMSTQSRDVNFEDINFKNSISTFRFMLGYRFREFGILKERAMDYSPIRIK